MYAVASSVFSLSKRPGATSLSRTASTACSSPVSSQSLTDDGMKMFSKSFWRGQSTTKISSGQLGVDHLCPIPADEDGRNGVGSGKNGPSF